MRFRQLFLLPLVLFVFCAPSAVSAQEDNEGGARFTWFLYTPGPGVLTNFGVVVDGHRLYGTLGVVGNFDELAPFPAPIRTGVRWGYRRLSVWAEYFYFSEINTLFNDFLVSDYGEGFKLDVRWGISGDLASLSLRNRLFVGNGSLPRIGVNPLFYESFGLAVSLFRSTPVPDPAYSIFAEIDGGIVAFTDSPDIAYGINLSLPIKLFRSSLLITPRMDYASNNGGRIIKESGATGFTFDNYATFDRIAFFDSDQFIPRAKEPRASDLAFALKVEGRWYFLEPLYIAGASDLYLKGFTDLAYLTYSNNIDGGNFQYALGGGIGYEWTVVSLSFNLGYQGGVGMRFSLNVNLAL